MTEEIKPTQREVKFIQGKRVNPFKRARNFVDKVFINHFLGSVESTERNGSPYKEVKFTDEQKSVLNTVGREINEFFLTKLRRFEIPETYLDRINRVNYVYLNKQDCGGYWDPFKRIGYVEGNPDSVDLLGICLGTVHEKSHGLGRTELRIYLGKKPDAGFAQGITTIGNRQTRALVLEEGLADMDAVEFYQKHGSRLFLGDIERRLSALLESPEIRAEVEWVNSSYGPVDEKIIAAYVRRQREGNDIKTYICSVAIGCYRLTEEVCRTIGHVLAKEAGKGDIPESEKIQLGRDLLDRDKFPQLRNGKDLQSNEGLKTIVRVLGPKAAKLLIGIDTFDDKVSDKLQESMAAVREVQRRLGLYAAGKLQETKTDLPLWDRVHPVAKMRTF